MKPGGLLHRAGANVRDHALWHRGDRVVIAVSGGLDSMVLLDVLVRTGAWHGGALEVATVDHRQRPDSAADAAFVAEMARAHGLVAHVLFADLGPGAAEDAARRARYDALATLGPATLALAHHERDQAETVLVQLLRGTGVHGLAGMGWRAGDRVRPLLDVPYEELVAYAQDAGLAWREDPSNQSPRFLRNRVRHEVLPLLEAIRPGAVRAIARSTRHAAADRDFLDAALAAAGPVAPGRVPTALLRDGDDAIARLAVRRAFPGLASAHVDAVVAAARAGGGSVPVPDGVIVVTSEIVTRP